MTDPSIFADLDSPLREPPLFHIDPKDKDERSEDERQGEFVARVGRTPGLHVAAVLNDHNWGQRALNRANRLGAWWGFPDTIVTAEPRMIAMLEFKDGMKMPKQHQVDCMNVLFRMGFPVGVFRTADSAFAFLTQHGFPTASGAI